MGYKSTHVRYTLVKREGDKTFSDYIQTTVKVLAEKGLSIKPCKLPRKLKKKLKNLFSWEFEIIFTGADETLKELHFKIVKSMGRPL